jgi:hypothetical protein
VTSRCDDFVTCSGAKESPVRGGIFIEVRTKRFSSSVRSGIFFLPAYISKKTRNDISPHRGLVFIV